MIAANEEPKAAKSGLETVKRYYGLAMLTNHR